jgi:hypothetical protein
MLNSQVLRGYRLKASRHYERLGRVIRNPQLELTGKRHLAQLRERAKSELRVDERKGCLRFDVRTFPEADAPFRSIRDLGKAWSEQEQAERHEKRGYPINMLLPSDLQQHPEFLNFALRDEFLLAASEYLGQVPRLVNLGLWRSPNSGSKYWRVPKSQEYHYDHRDSRQVKIFLNLTSVDEESGPLHFLPADACRRFDGTVGYTKKKIPDDVVYSVCSREEVIDNCGEEGTGVMVDTGRCLHYGSRKNSRDRLLLMISYARPNCTKPGECATLDPVREELARERYADDPVRRYALLASPTS